MLELVKPSNVPSKKIKSPTISLVEMIKQDPELRDFFLLVHKEDLREKAVSAVSSKIEKMKKAEPLRPSYS